MFNEVPSWRRLPSLSVLLTLVMHAGPAFADDGPAPELPVYRAQMAPPATLSYQMRNGWMSGSGDLHWRPAAPRYEARLEAQVAGLHVLTETSTGRLDAHGLAPLRYTDKRIRRALTAADFRWDQGKITYAGPHAEVALPDVAQDRLSWMIQLGAVLNAEPQHAQPGGSVAFFVSGSKGDAETWVFRYAGVETLQTPVGSLRAVKFTRAPRQPGDKRVEIWLATAHHHLPARARFTASADGDVFELLLRDMQIP